MYFSCKCLEDISPACTYSEIRDEIKFIYHMARTAPRALLLQNYWENARMRAVRISAGRAGKSRTALLGTRTAPCDAILEDFVAF